ncbi:hypothetical protein SERLADRAFT_470135 [Serpula lacrymans var. lacrymans S7.9]|uniref:Uncharacterized protein n=1 Tax=Serpula lacrymans var. lacrymans (strain S7.9) TaxID=578457 RepID=F8NYW7_SERL9|nr:uncharacterized protein SERLADRAFT_470135 [Serpula lacrymans var. lacrymans S7.9]EGO23788.1 hypothetical protein SERLADRAFT_470135 [Serpula lacrymans var. lacrymans S7.9]
MPLRNRPTGKVTILHGSHSKQDDDFQVRTRNMSYKRIILVPFAYSFRLIVSASTSRTKANLEYSIGNRKNNILPIGRRYTLPSSPPQKHITSAHLAATCMCPVLS